VPSLPSDDNRFAHTSLLNAIPDAVVIVDDRGRIVEANVRTESLFGYRREELLGQSVEMLIPPRYHGVHVNEREEYHGAPHVRPMGVGRELKALHKDGHEFVVEISLAPYQTAGGEQVVSTIRDVSARRTPGTAD
jgi:PAS domain S-box-containing protein